MLAVQRGFGLPEEAASALAAEPRCVAEVGPGETVGEIGLLSGGARSAGIRATRDSLRLRMGAAAFDRLSQRRPELTRQLAGSIATRLRDRTAGGTSIRRSPRTIALLPLDQHRLGRRARRRGHCACCSHPAAFTIAAISSLGS